jgi:hypothetical protein
MLDCEELDCESLFRLDVAELLVYIKNSSLISDVKFRRGMQQGLQPHSIIPPLLRLSIVPNLVEYDADYGAYVVICGSVVAFLDLLFKRGVAAVSEYGLNVPTSTFLYAQAQGSRDANKEGIDLR